MFILPAILAVLNVLALALYVYKDIVARKHAIATLNTRIEEAKEMKRKIAGDWYRNTKTSKN